MKFKYALLLILGMLALTPLFAGNKNMYFIFQIICLIIFTFCAILAWKEKKIIDLEVYLFFFLLYIFRMFDNDDKYFFVEIILFVVFFLIVFFTWRKKEKV